VRPVAPTFPWFKILWLLFVRKFKRQSVKKSSQSGRTKKKHQQWDSNNFRARNPRVTARILTAIGPEVNIFSTYCSSGEFLLHFLKVIITDESFSRFLQGLLNLPRLGVRRHASGTSGGVLSFSKDKNNNFIYYIRTHTHTHTHMHTHTW
jgi:hypothetical protein